MNASPKNTTLEFKVACAGIRAHAAARRRARARCWRCRRAVGKSEFGLCGVAGGMMVIEMLAGNMGRGRGRIAVVEDDMRQTYTVKHIRKGLTLLSYKKTVNV